MTNETWVVEEGDRIIRKKASCEYESLTPWEKLVYVLWVADYAMRNGGDLGNANAIFCDFQAIGVCVADKLSLPLTRNLFSMKPDEFERVFLDNFERVCDEIKNAETQG